MKIGIDIGGSHIGVGLVDRTNHLIEKKQKDLKKEELNRASYVIINTILKMIEELLTSHHLLENSIDLIGIATPGTPVDGVIYGMNNLGIKEFRIQEELRKYFSVRILVRNDGKCAGLCEKKMGSLKPYSDAIFLCIGTGVGGAVFMQDRLLTPKTFPGFEIGHLIIQKEGNLCKCGKRGCFETYASMKRLKEQVQKIFNLSSDISSKAIFEILREDKVLEPILQEYIEYLSIGVSNLINLYEPEAIAFGGSFVYLYDKILKQVEEEIKRKDLTMNPYHTRLLPAVYKNDAGIIGATICS